MTDRVHGSLPEELRRRLEQLPPERRALLERQLGIAGSPTDDRIPGRPDGLPAPLAAGQEMMWRMEQALGDVPAYNVPRVLRVRGPLDAAALREAVSAVVARHEILRTRFVDTPDGPRQLVEAEGQAPFELIDLSDLDAEAREAEASRAVLDRARRRFRLDRDAQLRTTLIRLAPDEHLLLLLSHHVVSDETSRDVLFRDLAALYDRACGRPGTLPDLPIQFGDYAAWQRARVDGGDLAGQLDYWRERLAGVPALDLPLDRARGAGTSFDGARRSYTLGSGLTETLAAIGRAHDASMFMVLLAAFEVLLSRYSRQQDFAVGVPSTGRTHPDVEDLIGNFSNVLVLRADLADDPPFGRLLERVRETALGAFENQDLPLETITLELRAGQPYSPLFQTFFALQRPAADLPRLGEAALSPEPLDFHAAKVDLGLVLAEEAGSLRATVEYRTALFDAATIDRMMAHLDELLGGIARAPGTAVTRLPMLPAAERAQIDGWNATGIPFDEDATLSSLVRRQAAATPAAVAVEFGDVAVTYEELDRRADRFAAYLHERGVAPGGLVGLHLERSDDLVAAVLGVHRAGAAYLPIDPSYPPERIAFMLEDSGARLVVSQRSLRSALPETVTVVLLDEEREAIARGAAPAPLLAEDPRRLAYVIYTSGSTGRPKGVQIEHRSVVNFLTGLRRSVPMGPGDTILAVTSLSFDISVLELFHPLTTGGRIVMAPRSVATDPVALMRMLEGDITHLQATPSTWRMLVEAGWSGRRGLVALCGGEALPQGLADELVGRGLTLWNLYGPTEATIWATMQRQDAGQPVRIGRPMPNVTAHVLDAVLEPVPIGVIGELYLGGVGLARGYLNRPELNAERFVEHPEEGRLYRTGDLARWTQDGALDFLGRTDHQVKLRGHRIELGEIEAVLATHPSVGAGAVIVREDRPGDPRLVAYVTAAPGAEAPAPTELREHVRRALPEYMVPAAVVVLDRLPVNANGKLDRGRLPAPDASAMTAAETYVAPRTALEGDIAEAWATVMGLERVGVEDNFFDLGGHSLVAMRIVARLAGRLPARLSIGDVLETATVAELARRVEARSMNGAAGAGAVQPILRRAGDSTAPLSYAQQLVWLFEQMTPGLPTYNVPLVRRVRGGLDVEALRHAVNGVVQRHEVLRTSFVERDGEPVQVVGAASPEVTLVDLTGEADPGARGLEILLREAARPFDLAGDALLRALVVRVAEEDALLLLLTHHIAFDGASAGVLTRELSALYAAAAADDGTGRATPPTDGAGLAAVAPSAALPALPIQFADYAAWERETLAGERLDSLLAWWRRTLEGAPGTVDLPTDRPRGPEPSGPGARYTTHYSTELADALHRLARDHDATLFMVLLAGFQALLHRYSGQADIVVGAPVSGRIRSETQDLIGFFANTLPIRARLDGDPGFASLIRQVRESCLGAYEHQDVPYEKLVLEMRPGRDADDAGLFSVVLVLQDADAPDLRLGEATIENAPVHLGAAKFDLAFSAADMPGGLRLSVEYRADLFDEGTVQRMVGHLATLLTNAAANPAEPVSRLGMLPPDELERVSTWALPAPVESAPTTLHERFQDMAARTPDAVALTCEGRSMTYRELDRRANRLAYRLRGLGVGPDTLVGLCAERSLDLVVAILGILKAGGAYLPLDPSYPADRLAFMAEDSAAPVIVAQQAVADRLPESSATVVWLEDLAFMDEANDDACPETGVAPHHLAYVIYTSGSTGKPKGVLITHANVTRLFDATDRWFGFDGTDVWTLFHSYAFDFSVWELWGALLYGGRLVVVPFLVSRSPESFLELLERERVTVLNQTPSAFRPLMAVAVERDRDLALRYTVFGGEALDPAILAPWVRKYGDRRPRFINMYGITETTVHVTYRPLDEADILGGRGSVIGEPIPDLGLYLMDPNGQPVAIGLPGEIYVGGAGVARGYLNRPELTAYRFVPDPRGTGTLYRSGDLARLRADGELEYLGRMDHQVKIRGFRVELGEIETVLTSHPGVRDGVVLCHEDAPGEKRILAYYTPGADAVSAAELRAHLGGRLPDYMVPSAIVRLDALPLTGNGKLDRRALPVPSLGTADDEGELVAPAGATEQLIALVWAEVLGVERVSVDWEFFAVGGHSLLAMQVVARVSRLLRVQAPLGTFFRNPTVRGFAAALIAAETTPGEVEATARAVLRLRAMTPEEREALRGRAAPAAAPAEASP